MDCEAIFKSAWMKVWWRTPVAPGPVPLGLWKGCEHTCWDVDADTPALHCDLSHLILYDQYVSTSSVCCLSEWLDVLLPIPIPKQGCQTIQLYCVVLVVNCAYKCLLEFLQRLFCCVYSSIHIAVFTHYHCVLQSFVLPDILFFLQFRPFKRGFLSFHIPLPFSFCFLLCYSA